ncbi:type 1 glutamine amidotransferase-like domain-containing protein [Ramlibacter terrae]|uniref:Type 1 glutamine amidotransferase-like domain-containing protein n=1 Tax=Ramlibacter terrae TaxID=2732511 RepID=A0ABX6P5H9_9BURK|nr:type 1 glutamine amidotransferase-like domain-containing protein [Ramlibacter terrae]
MRRRDFLASSLLAGATHRLAAQAPAPGTLFVIGGAEDRVHDRHILRRFLAHAGGPQARIRMLATASSVPLIVGASYRAAFAEIGATDCELLPLLEGDAAFQPEVVQAIPEADAIFITGGNQARLMEVLRETPAWKPCGMSTGSSGAASPAPARARR